MNTPYPMLWFEDQAEEAARFYTSLLPNSEITDVQRRAEGVPGGEPGTVMTVTFTLDGARFVALNGGPHDAFNDSISLVVECADQIEINRLWNRLIAGGGHEVQCGWLVDRYGLRWQIVPANIAQLLAPPGAVEAMLQMTKLDIAALEAAAS
jgi:predicted 3-demethylubiquinone-9 3-methyltransferase (glyoxalase superfamily)